MKNQTSPIGIVVVNTKSNFKNLNFKELVLIEIFGTRVTASVYSEELAMHQNVDFTLSEVESIFTHPSDVEYAKQILKYDFNFNLPLSK
jgi:hypothetical protein